MRKFWSLFVLSGVLAGAFIFTGSAKADDGKEKKESAKVEAKGDAAEAPEFIDFGKAKIGNVKFPHKKHAEILEGKCDACHGGETPLFAKKTTGDMKMADMYAGKSCGHCHDGKMKHEDKAIFPAKGGCMKCHKKDKK